MYRQSVSTVLIIGSKSLGGKTRLRLKYTSIVQITQNPNFGCKLLSSSAYCMDLVKRRDYEHYLTTLLLPDNIRQIGFALRALNVELASIRDNVSEAATGKMRAQFWKDAITGIYEQKTKDRNHSKIPDHPVVLELHKSLLKHPNMSYELLNRLLSSREVFLSDHKQPFQTMEDVETYSNASFSTINNILLECLSHLDSSDEINGHARHCASQLGKAEGIVTVLRAMPFNASHRRVYLPTSQLVAHKISLESIIRGKDSDELRHVIETIAAVAEDHLQNCRFRKKYLSRDEKLLMLPAVAIDGYLSKLHQARCNVFDSKLQIKDSWLPIKLYTHKWKKSY